MHEDQIKRIVEAAVLASSKPLSIDELLGLFEEREEITRGQIRQALDVLGQECAERGVELKEVASGFRYQVRTELSPWISRLWAERPSRYSRALLETLALVAYRQPITRGEIEDIRGVSVSTSIMKTLQEREWVKVVGHRDVPGKPAMYATTKQFLDYFDLKSLDELPTLAELRDIDSINAELELTLPGIESPEGASAPAQIGEAPAESADQAPQASEQPGAREIAAPDSGQFPPDDTEPGASAEDRKEHSGEHSGEPPESSPPADAEMAEAESEDQESRVKGHG